MLIPINSNGRSIVRSDEILAILEVPKKPVPNADPAKVAEFELQTLVFVRGAQLPLTTDMDPIVLANFANEANGVPLKFEVLNMLDNMKKQEPVKGSPNVE